MAYQPRTMRTPHPEDGARPCIHFSDHRNVVLQVHHTEGDLGFSFTNVVHHAVLGVVLIEVLLSPGQTAELMDYLRAEA